MNINISDDVVNSIVSMYTAFAPQQAEEVPTLSNMLPPSPMVRPPSLGSSLDSFTKSDSREAQKETNEVYQTGYYLYWIANYTGEPIEYYVEEGKYAEWNAAKTSVVHLVENGQKVPLRLSRSLFKVLSAPCSFFAPFPNCTGSRITWENLFHIAWRENC
jgi:hypothetical protein